MSDVYNRSATFLVSDTFTIVTGGNVLVTLDIGRTHVPISQLKIEFNKSLPRGRRDVAVVPKGSPNNVFLYGSTTMSEKSSRVVELGPKYKQLVYTPVAEKLSGKFTVGELVNYLKVHQEPRRVFPGLDLFSGEFFDPVTNKTYLNKLSYSFLDTLKRGYIPVPPYYLYKKRCGISCKDYVKTFARDHAAWYSSNVTTFKEEVKLVVFYKPKDATDSSNRFLYTCAVLKSTGKMDSMPDASGKNHGLGYYEGIQSSLNFESSDRTNAYLDMMIMAYDISTLPPPTSEDDVSTFCSVLNNMLAFDWWYVLQDHSLHSLNDFLNLLTFAPDHVKNLIRTTLDDCSGGFSGVVTTRFDTRSDLDRYRNTNWGMWEPYTEGQGSVKEQENQGIKTWEQRLEASASDITKYYETLATWIKGTPQNTSP